ncbi:MAG: VWA domain-containing protein, partial [Gemmataceae bacterium]
MSVLHLWMLWLLPLAALPIVLHLLTLHRLRTVELPTFRFLFDSYIQQRRRMQFLEALLAMLRTLFLLFLIFMVCRPVVKHWDQLFGGSAGGSGGREVILLVDCSASMNARGGGTAALDRAKAAAVSVVDRLRSADQVTLIRVTARPEEVLSRFNTDTQGIKDRIEALEPSSSRANLFAALLQLFGPEANRRTNPVVYLFTDGQASTWKEARAQGLERLIPAGTPFTLVNVGATRLGTEAAGGDTRPVALENRAVVGDAPRRNRAIVGLPFVLTPRIVNHGRTEAELTLSVLIDEKEVARTQVTVKPGEAMTRSVVYTPSQSGLQRGRFEITGKTPDVFPDDDRFLFTLTVQPKVRVLVVNGNPSDDPLTDEAHHLVTALTSQAAPAEADGKKPVGPTSREIQRSLDVVDLPQPGLTVDALRDASIVILANCGALTDPQWGWLRAFVADGGGLLVFPGDKVSAASYTAQLAKVPGRGGSTLTAATLLDPVGDVDKADTYTALEFDPGHPALSVFNPKESFRTVRVYRHFRLELPAKRGNGWPVARFEADRTPAVVESRHGDGVVLVAGFPVHPRWGNLPLKPDFVPLMLRLVVHAEHRPEAEVAPVVIADSAAEVAVSA